MKKISFLSAAVLLIFAAFSCTKEKNVDNDDICQDAVVTAISADIESTKTALGAKEGSSWPNYWKEGDKISINGVESGELDSEADGKASATFYFTGTGVLTPPYYAAYPSSAVSAYDSGTATITLPATQNYVAASYDPAAFLMLGSGDVPGNVSLSSKVSILHVSLTGTGSISKVRVTGAAGAALSGDFTTDFSTLTPGTVSNIVEMVAATPVDLPADFFICVPAGLSGSIQVKAFDSNGGSMAKNATLKNALAAGQVYSPAALAYAASPGYFSISAEGITSSTAIICLPDDSYAAEALTFNVYSDADCGTLVDSYAVDAGNACWGGAAPRFCISGLTAGSTYYVKVNDDTAGTYSSVLPVTMADFTIVQPSSTPAAVNEVILAEDFSELRWDCDYVGGGVGFFPTSKDSFANADVDDIRAVSTSNEKTLSAQADALAASRLSHWAQGANDKLYIHPGYIKIVGNSKPDHLVTPALDNIPDGKLATLEVTVTASAYRSSNGTYATTSAIVAVQPAGTYNELGDTPNTNTLDLSTNIKPITLDEALAWKEYTVTLTGVGKGARLAFGADASITDNNARMNISDIKVTVKALEDPALVASVKAVSSSSAVFTWTYGGEVAADIAKPYTIALYRNSTLSNLVVSYTIPADDDCWNGKVPCFVFGGLNPGTEYWFVATDTDANVSSDPVSATTEAFTVVDATTVTNAAVGDVILAEDFSEIGAGPDEIARAAGFKPSSSKVLPYIPSGANPDGSFEKDIDGYNPYGDRIIGAGWDLGSSRLSNGWGFFGGSSCYYGAGYLRLATSSGRTHIVTPALSGIPAGKLATIQVTVTASKYESSGSDVAVFAENGLTIDGTDNLSSSSYKKYTGASLYDGHALGITAVKSWETKSVTINKVESDYHLLIGSLADAKNRCYISDVVVSIVSLKDKGAIDAVMEISDFATLKAFLTACEPGKVIQGNVTADIDLTSAQVEEIDALYPVAEFEGIINGNNHTISGLTKPLFAQFTGTVSNLTLNSTLNITTAMNNIGILACRANDATISGCVTNGSITLNCASEVDGELSIGGLVGLNNSGTMTNCVNNASITNNSSSNGEMHIGGIAGVSHAELESCSNTGDITNNGSTDTKEINVAGVVAICSADLTSCSNSGAISNTATSGTTTIQDAQIGGIVANIKDPGYTLTSCYNTGTVSNSGAASSISIGGIAAWSTKGTFVTCYNTGGIENTGTGADSDAGVRMGGLVGCASNANTLTGTSSAYNYNEGTLNENSATEMVAVGGICGFTTGAASDFAHVHNLSTQSAGDILIQNNTRNKIYVGGIIGKSSVVSSFDYANNAGKILFKDLTMSATGQVFAGGIIGGWTAKGTQTITGCVNSGCIECDSSDHNDLNVGSTATPLWSFFGGISGMGGSYSNEGLNGGYNTITGKTFTNCTNTGYIWIYGKVRSCIGGVVAYTENNPSGCVCTANITLHKSGGVGKVGSNYHREIVGGVVGLCTATYVSNLKYKGTLNSNGSSPQAYAGGILGYTYKFNSSGTAIEMDNCKVGGSVRSTNTGGAALMCYSASGNEITYTFTNCIIEKGAMCFTTSKTAATMNSDSDVTQNDCLGNGTGHIVADTDNDGNPDLPTVADSI